MNDKIMNKRPWINIFVVKIESEYFYCFYCQCLHYKLFPIDFDWTSKDSDGNSILLLLSCHQRCRSRQKD